MAEKSILAVLNLYVWIKIRVATIDTNDSVNDSWQSNAASIQKPAKDRGLNGRAFRSSSKAEILPSVRGLHATHAVQELGNPYIRHTSTDMLQLGF